MKLEEQLKIYFNLNDIVCENLNTLANDVFAVTAPTNRFALKIYNPASRTADEVRWELDLTVHLIQNNVPVAKPVLGKDGYVNSFLIDGQKRVAVLFEWAAGEKPKPEPSTYVLLGKAAAQIHRAADTFTSTLLREEYDATALIDEQLGRMKTQLIEARQWQRTFDLGERMKQIVANPALAYGICHMDLTLDNIHRDGDTMTVFDFDSAGKCWRALEPYLVLKSSEDKFKSWLKGYRSVQPFSKEDESAVAAFVIIGELRNVVWKLGLARSSRGKPILGVSDLADVVDEWLGWESNKYLATLSL